MSQQLLMAISSGDTEKLIDLLASGETIKMPDGGTVLHFAASNGMCEVLKILLDAGAGIDDRNSVRSACYCSIPFQFFLVYTDLCSWGYDHTVGWRYTGSHDSEQWTA